LKRYPVNKMLNPPLQINRYTQIFDWALKEHAVELYTHFQDNHITCEMFLLDWYDFGRMC